MKHIRLLKPLLALAAVAALASAGYLTRQWWLPLFRPAKPAAPIAASGESGKPTDKVIVTDQAQKNLGLTAKPLKAQTFWRSIQVPGMVVDRPGHSDRGVVAPTTAVVTKIAHIPGDTVRAGEVLFTLRLLSESLHTTQTELFKATEDLKLARAKRERMAPLSKTVAGEMLIDVDSQITRLEVAAKAYRQELQNRGVSPSQIAKVTEGTYATEIPIVVPPHAADARPLFTSVANSAAAEPTAATFEVQELKVELGQVVQPGQTLCLLAHHLVLAIEGRAFRDETPLLERSVKENWPVEIDFQEDASAGWPDLNQKFHIRHLANNIDPVNRTFAFLIPLENEARAVAQVGRTQLLWRFRPGQKVRLLVRVEKFNNVFVLPSDAIAREGLEAFIFTQNVNTFERKPVRVLFQDRQHVVIANDGSLVPGIFVTQSAAAQLNRMVKAGSSGVPKGYHIHADGSLHKNEDEAK